MVHGLGLGGVQEVLARALLQYGYIHPIPNIGIGARKTMGGRMGSGEFTMGSVECFLSSGGE